MDAKDPVAVHIHGALDVYHLFLGGVKSIFLVGFLFEFKYPGLLVGDFLLGGFDPDVFMVARRTQFNPGSVLMTRWNLDKSPEGRQKGLAAFGKKAGAGNADLMLEGGCFGGSAGHRVKRLIGKAEPREYIAYANRLIFKRNRNDGFFAMLVQVEGLWKTLRI